MNISTWSPRKHLSTSIHYFRNFSAETTDVTLRRSGDNISLKLTLNNELVSLELHKHETSIPNRVPVYVSENGLVEQIIPDLYEVDVSCFLIFELTLISTKQAEIHVVFLNGFYFETKTGFNNFTTFTGGSNRRIYRSSRGIQIFDSRK